MRVAVLLFVGMGILAVNGACSGPGATNDACTSEMNECVPAGNCKGDTMLQTPCSNSPAGYVCCPPDEVVGVVGDAGSD